MPEQITITVYSFDELDEAAKKHALVQGRAVFQCESDEIKEMFVEALKELGYPTKFVYFSLSNSQGDGMAFYGSFDPLPVATRLGFNTDDLIGIEDIEWKIAGENNRYHHWNSMELVTNCDLPEPLQKLYEAISEDIRNVSKDLEARGYKMIEDVESDEEVANNIRANEWKFYKGGRVFQY